MTTDLRQQSPRGDERRAALLASLDAILLEGTDSLDAVNIADISRRAGVTRSAFYFYFESKAAAVAELMADFYAASFEAAQRLRDPLGPAGPAGNIEAMVRTLVGAWATHRHLYRAMLDARATSGVVRAMWDADRESFVPHLASTLDAELAAGRARPGFDPLSLAAVLLELNDRMLERLARTPDLDREQLIRTVCHVWTASIYGDPR